MVNVQSYKERETGKKTGSKIVFCTSHIGTRMSSGCSTSSLLGKSVFLGFILFSDPPRIDPTNVRCVRMRCIIMQHERVCQCGYTGAIHLPTYLPTYTRLSNYLLIYLPTPAFPRQRTSPPPPMFRGTLRSAQTFNFFGRGAQS